MSSYQIEIQLIMLLVSVCCALPGVFLVLRKMALISDAISHSILPGIVLGFLLTHNLQSPWLILLAAVSGLATVILVEYIQSLGLVKKDTAIGLVFPTFFSIGILLIAQFANDVHLDTDAVLLGDPIFAPFDRWTWNGTDMGPKSLWVSGMILALIISFITLFYKELKLSTFDKLLAASLGFSPMFLHYGLMAISSITIVGAFDAVGAILVVALMIAPASTAYLLTQKLKPMIFISVGIGGFAAIAGYWLAHLLDASVAGSVVTVLGILYFGVYFFSPRNGYLRMKQRMSRQKLEIYLLTFLLHIRNHEEEQERMVKHLEEHIDWEWSTSKKVLKLALNNNLIHLNSGIITLTSKGENFTEKSVDYIVNNQTKGIEEMKEQYFLFRG